MSWTNIYLFMLSLSNIYASDKDVFEPPGVLVWGMQLKESYLQFNPKTLIECAKECLRRKRCKSINYSNVLLICELNYKTDGDAKKEIQNHLFVYSDIMNWPKNMVTGCEINPCRENEVCKSGGSCSVLDCGPINFPIPNYAVIVSSGHHEIGNGVGFQCEQGYVMNNPLDGSDGISTVLCESSGLWQAVNFTCYKGCIHNELEIDQNAEIVESVHWRQSYKIRCKTGYSGFGDGGKPLSYVEAFCNPDNNQWVLDNMYCINPSSMLKDFCPPGYTYNANYRLCYKYYRERKTYEEAQRICQTEHAHLISPVFEDVLKFILDFSDRKSFFIDGKYDTIGNKWKGWDGQQIPNKAGNVSDILGCLIAEYGHVHGSICDVNGQFICQFEICPESAGYKLMTKYGICYKFQASSIFTNTDDMCRLNFPFEVDFVTTDTGVRFKLYRDLIVSTDDSLQGRAYKLFHDASKTAGQILIVCKDNDMHAAKVDTPDIRRTATNVIVNRTSAVVVGLYLRVQNTYLYFFKDGTRCSYVFSNLIKDTDTNKCIIVRKGNKAASSTAFRNVDCNVYHASLCADLKPDRTANNFEMSDNKTTYEDAGKWCTMKGKSLIKIFSKQTKDDVKEYLTNYTNVSLYIDMKLYNKSYTYWWYNDVVSSSVDWAEDYSNAIRDTNRRVAFNVTTQKLHVIAYNTKLPFLCSTASKAIWIGLQDGASSAYVFDKRFRRISVSVNNRVPYICEVNMKSMIHTHRLYKKKKPLG